MGRQIIQSLAHYNWTLVTNVVDQVTNHGVAGTVQFVQTDTDRLEILLLPAEGSTAETDRRLVTLTTELCGPTMRVTSRKATAEDLVRSPSGKLRPVVGLVDQPSMRT